MNKILNYKSKNLEKGQVMIISVVLFLLLSLVAVFGMINPLIRHASALRAVLQSKQGFYLAEAGMEDIVYRLKFGIAVASSQVLSIGTYSVTTTVTDQVDGKKVVSNGNANDYLRKLETNLVFGTGVSFHYGVQVGQGGLEMSNSSKIIGNVYSNGNIIGTNSARIQGTAIVAGPAGIIDGMDIDGDAWSHTIRGTSTVGGKATHSELQNTTVSGNVVADSISNCTIGGTAKYDIRSSCTVIGTITTPNPDIFVPADILPLPISEAQIDTWESEAVSGGTISTQTFSSGIRSLGPKKIDGNLILSGDAILVVTGTLWVTGEIKLSNTSIIKLDVSYGSSSGVVMAGIDESLTVGYIEISNSAQALGSGSAGSYIMLLSQREMGSNAIKTSNGSTVAILYAGEGEIEIGNSAALKEVTANKLKITNSATVTYESGLSNTNFSSGPSGGFEISKWKEVE